MPESGDVGGLGQSCLTGVVLAIDLSSWQKMSSGPLEVW